MTLEDLQKLVSSVYPEDFKKHFEKQNHEMIRQNTKMGCLPCLKAILFKAEHRLFIKLLSQTAHRLELSSIMW